MSVIIASEMDPVNKAYSEARRIEEKNLDTIKPQLAALLVELVEEFQRLEKESGGMVLKYDLPSIDPGTCSDRFSLSGAGIIRTDYEGLGGEVYDPVKYVKEAVTNINAATILLNRIRQFEEKVGLNVNGDYSEWRIKLTGKYFQEARELYEGKRPLAVVINPANS